MGGLCGTVAVRADEKDPPVFIRVIRLQWAADRAVASTLSFEFVSAFIARVCAAYSQQFHFCCPAYFFFFFLPSSLQFPADELLLSW